MATIRQMEANQQNAQIMWRWQLCGVESVSPFVSTCELESTPHK